MQTRGGQFHIAGLGKGRVPGDSGNNFGVLRLLFAAMVVLSHSPELVDGNRSREILTRLFGTLSFGEVAVDGFFLVSGYLITKSFAQCSDPMTYLTKRVLRIFPGYLVAFWICVLAVAPVVGGAGSFLTLHPLIQNPIVYNLQESLFLRQPDVTGSFHGVPYPVLNGSMWTIPYEARCYVLVLLVGSIGRMSGLRSTRLRWILLLATIAGLLVSATGILNDVIGLDGQLATRLVGVLSADVSFLSVFGVGSMFYLFRNTIRFTRVGVIAAAVVLALLMLNRDAANVAFAVLGGYLVFWFALEYRVLRVSLADNRTDLSYGLYLYAWPIQNLAIWCDRSIDPWLLCAITLLGAGLLGYASWHFVEKHAIRLGHRMFQVEFAANLR